MVALTIAIVGILSTVLVAAWSIRRHGAMPVIDPSIERHWLVTALARHPGVASFVARRLSRQAAGGLLLTAALTFVFVLSVFAGWVFDTLDEVRGFAAFDESVAEWGAANATTTSTFVLNLITGLGGTEVIIAVSIAVAAYAWWRYRNLNVAMFVVSVAISQAVVNNGLKWIIDRERPAISQLAGWAGSSFPSGHTAAAAATYAAVALVIGLGHSERVRAWLAAAAISIALAVGATRALLGVHWLTDVLAGLAVGWVCFIVCGVAFGSRLMQFGEPVAAATVPDTGREVASPPGVAA